jgi:hypothetical protein
MDAMLKNSPAWSRRRTNSAVLAVSAYRRDHLKIFGSEGRAAAAEEAATFVRRWSKRRRKIHVR